MDWSNEKIPWITKLLPPKLKVVRLSFLKNSVISKKHHKRPVSVLPVSILPRMVLEHFKKASSTFSPVRALVSKNINSAVKKFILKSYYLSVVVFCVCNIIEHRQQTALFGQNVFTQQTLAINRCCKNFHIQCCLVKFEAPSIVILAIIIPMIERDTGSCCREISCFTFLPEWI